MPIWSTMRCQAIFAFSQRLPDCRHSILTGLRRHLAPIAGLC